MPVVIRMSAAGLRSKVESGTLVEWLTGQYGRLYGRNPGRAEQGSWERSLSVLAADLVDAGLGDVEVLVEYGLPQTNYRADAVLCGIRPGTGTPSYVVVELKQWTEVLPAQGAPDMVLVRGYPTEKLHPAEQVRRYCTYMANFLGALSRPGVSLTGAAYLHNANDMRLGWLRDRTDDDRSRVFTGATRGEFLQFLRSRLSPASGAAVADDLIASKVAPSKALMTVAAAEIRDREQFVLLDEQQVAYSIVQRAVAQARSGDRKEVVIISGGPGSGKSAIALSLLGDAYRRGITARYATGSRSFTLTMRKIAGYRKREVQDLFTYFMQFGDADRNGLELLICDEAHRIRETSVNRYTPAARRTGKPQVEELIDAARVPVFLLDEHQVVRPGEMGTVAEIEQAAAGKGLDVRVISLAGQFRVGGSAAYDRWVRVLLGLEPGDPYPWTGDDGRFQLRVAGSPSELEAYLAERLGKDGNGARMTAGFCWDWSDPAARGLVLDVKIGGWHRPWNVKGDRRVDDAPPSALWATEPGGFGQVGCVYTAQGFEYPWNGVIFGPDFVRRGDHWVADRSKSRDTQVVAGTTDEEFEILARNVYKVLLTRGLVGTVLYSTDPETQDFFNSLIPSPAR